MNEYERGFQNGATSAYAEAQRQHNILKARINDVAVKLADRWSFAKDMNPYDQLDTIEGIVDQTLELFRLHVARTEETANAFDWNDKAFEDAFSILNTIPLTEDGKFIYPGTLLWIAHNFGGLISVTPEDWTAIGVLMQQGKLYGTKEGALEYINSRGKKATDDNG
jgi:hypothetical protein